MASSCQTGSGQSAILSKLYHSIEACLQLCQMGLLGSVCHTQSAAGQCNVYGTVVGDSAHPEGFCQQTCNHCNNYCVPKNGNTAPAAPSTPSGGSSSSSASCSDNPPSTQYTCAQQVKLSQPPPRMCTCCQNAQVDIAHTSRLALYVVHIALGKRLHSAFVRQDCLSMPLTGSMSAEDLLCVCRKALANAVNLS